MERSGKLLLSTSQSSECPMIHTPVHNSCPRARCSPKSSNNNHSNTYMNILTPACVCAHIHHISSSTSHKPLARIHPEGILLPVLGLFAFCSFLFFQFGILVDHLDQVSYHFSRTKLLSCHFARSPTLSGANRAGTSEEGVAFKMSGCPIFTFGFD